MNKVHVNGDFNPKNKKGLKSILEFWDGQFDDETDKGVIFTFEKEKDARGFARDINGGDSRVSNLFADSLM